VEETARCGENLIPGTVCAVESCGTVGEISDAMRRVFGEYQETVVAEPSSDFRETIRALALSSCNRKSVSPDAARRSAKNRPPRNGQTSWTLSEPRHPAWNLGRNPMVLEAAPPNGRTRAAPAMTYRRGGTSLPSFEFPKNTGLTSRPEKKGLVHSVKTFSLSLTARFGCLGGPEGT
jgi:hypothetical protein